MHQVGASSESSVYDARALERPGACLLLGSGSGLRFAFVDARCIRHNADRAVVVWNRNPFLDVAPIRPDGCDRCNVSWGSYVESGSQPRHESKDSGLPSLHLIGILSIEAVCRRSKNW